jgi:hypothetical protein
MPTTFIPPALAASTPAMASSKTTHSSGATPQGFRAPSKNTSGSGLALLTLLPSITASNRLVNANFVEDGH